MQTPPLPTPSPDATVTPFVVLYLTPTNEWQSVQVAESIIIEIPAAWTYFYPTGGYGDIGNGATFYDSNAASMPGTPATWVLYTQSPPNDRPPDEYPLVVDGYPARFGTWTDDVSGFGEPGNYPLWIGSLSIRTPERIHTLELRCNAPNGELGEAQQHAYHESCEAIRRHWAETTQIIE